MNQPTSIDEVEKILSEFTDEFFDENNRRVLSKTGAIPIDVWLREKLTTLVEQAKRDVLKSVLSNVSDETQENVEDALARTISREDK